MTDFVDNLVSRSLGDGNCLTPRPISRFESAAAPPKPTGRGEGLPDDEAFVESTEFVEGLELPREMPSFQGAMASTTIASPGEQPSTNLFTREIVRSESPPSAAVAPPIPMPAAVAMPLSHSTRGDDRSESERLQRSLAEALQRVSASVTGKREDPVSAPPEARVEAPIAGQSRLDSRAPRSNDLVEPWNDRFDAIKRRSPEINAPREETATRPTNDQGRDEDLSPPRRRLIESPRPSEPRGEHAVPSRRPTASEEPSTTAFLRRPASATADAIQPVSPSPTLPKEATSVAARRESAHPQIAPEHAPTTRNIQQAPPTIHVNIGRIEIRGVHESARATPRPDRRPASPIMSLEDYLRERASGGRG